MSKALKIDVPVTRDKNEIERSGKLSGWLADFADHYKQMESQQKTAVEVNTGPSIQEKMHAILNGNSRYNNVEEAVADLHERTGLKQYLEAKASDVSDAAKYILADDEGGDEKKAERPALLERVPAIEHYIRNMVNNGASLPAILFGIASTFVQDGVSDQDIDDMDLARYINQFIMSREPSETPLDDPNIGRDVGLKVDLHDVDQNKDPFVGLTPKKVM